MSNNYTIRVRSQVGTWRVANISARDTFGELKERLQKEHDAHFRKTGFSLDPSGKQLLSDDISVAEAKLANGSMIYADVDEYKVGAHEAHTGKKTITKDGQILVQHADEAIETSGFRPGMLPLRSMKMQWTLKEFVDLDDQFCYRMKAQEKSFCKIATLNSTAIQAFQNYLRQFDFRTIRVGYLYGKFLPDNSAKVELIYEPPQESTDTSFKVLEDPKADAVHRVAALLGLTKVGWIFAHPPREKGFHFSSYEVMFAAEQQLQAADGINDTPFVTVKVTLDEKSQAVVEAFQVSKQCMEMVAEGVISPSANLGHCTVNPTFTVYAEGKPVTEVDNNFFLVTTPVENFKSQFLANLFPVANRIDTMQGREDLKKQLSKAGKEGWTFIDLLADFQLLLFLSNFLTLEDDIPRICQSITNREIPLDEGYQLLLRSIAGIE